MIDVSSAKQSTLLAPHQSEAAFVGERSFSKSWGLRASGSFFLLRRHSFFLLSSQLSRRNGPETLAAQAIVRLAEPISRCVRWRTQVFKIEGFVYKPFLPSPPPPPSFIFWLSFQFSRGQNRSFFAPKPNRNAFQYAGYLVYFFSTADHFHLALVAASSFHFVTAATKFSCYSSNKKMSLLFFISCSRSLSPFFSLSFPGRRLLSLFSVFLLVYIPNLWT